MEFALLFSACISYMYAVGNDWWFLPTVSRPMAAAVQAPNDNGTGNNNSITTETRESQERLAFIAQIRPNLFLGGHLGADLPRLLLERKVTHVLNCAQDVVLTEEVERELEKKNLITYLRLDLLDFDLDLGISRAFPRAIDFYTKSEILFVHSLAGVNRAPAICIALLMHQERLSLRQAYFIVHRATNGRVNILRDNFLELEMYELSLHEQLHSPTMFWRDTH